jgi:hypothetical protein
MRTRITSIVWRVLLFLTAAFSLTTPLVVPASAASFITNGSFETFSGPPILGQGFLPDPWVTGPFPGADTYSNDGSFGLTPGAVGNFPGVTAYDGIRFVAGWSAVPEPFGQPLASPLVAGAIYNITGALHQALRADIDHPGGYNVYAATGLFDASPLFLVSTGATTNDTAWEPFSVNFTAPAGVDSKLFLLFIPFETGSGPAYPGFDAFSVADATVVPAPAALPLFATGLGALGLLGWRRKKKAAALAA